MPVNTAPNDTVNNEPCPVTQGLTTVNKATPFARSYRNLAALSRCLAFRTAPFSTAWLAVALTYSVANKGSIVNR